MLKSPKRRSNISVIIVEQLDTLDQIATSGKPLNRATAWSLQETWVSFHPLLLLLEISSKSSYSLQTWIVAILPLLCRFKGSPKGKVLPRCGRKKAPSDLVIFLSLPLLFLFLHHFCVLLYYFKIVYFFFFYALLWLTCFCLFVFQFCFILILFIKIKIKMEKLEKYKNNMCFVYFDTCVPWMAIETKFSKLFYLL